MSDREEYFREFLEMRGVDPDHACPGCQGFGVRAYGSTATWRGGIGGQMITSGICDRCWGSGDEHRKWTNLRTLQQDVERQVAERAVDAVARHAGADFASARESVAEIIGALDTLTRKRKLASSLWTRELARSLANLLRRAIGEEEVRR